MTGVERLAIGVNICARIWDMKQNLTINDVMAAYKFADSKLSDSTLKIYATNTLIVARKGKKHALTKSLKDFEMAIGDCSLALAF